MPAIEIIPGLGTIEDRSDKYGPHFIARREGAQFTSSFASHWRAMQYLQRK